MCHSLTAQPRMVRIIYQDHSVKIAQVVLDARFENDFKENYKELKDAFERLKILKVRHTQPVAAPSYVAQISCSVQHLAVHKASGL